MKLIDKKKYDDWKSKQVDEDGTPEPYGMAVFDYSEKWANIMEKKIEAGENLEDIAYITSHEADDDGITGFMYGMSVSILSQCWIHGEQLRRWHNIRTQIKNEGEKANKEGVVLNPALLNIGK